jgi:hypothetical protein
MADDSQRAKARAAFGKTFFEAARPKPAAKNSAVASQKVANSRPIPTYKDGGKVMADRVAARIAAGNYSKGGKIQTSADTARELATEMGGMTPVKKAVGGTGKCRKGMAPIKKKDGGVAKKAVGGRMGSRSGGSRLDKYVNYKGSVDRGITSRTPRDGMASGPTASDYAGMTGDQIARKFGSTRTPSGAVRLPDTSNAYRTKGPMARKSGGEIRIDLKQAKRDTAVRDAAAKKRAEAARYRETMGSQGDILKRAERSQGRDMEEVGSMKPVKRAKGGAGKVRKGMMTAKGDIKSAVKPKKGIGGYM